MIDGGDLCRCGRRGCLETVASMRALVEQAGAAGDAELVAAFHAGDEPARSAVLAGARALGLAIGGLIGALSVRRFALIGSALAFGPDWLQENPRDRPAFGAAVVVGPRRGRLRRGP